MRRRYSLLALAPPLIIILCLCAGCGAKPPSQEDAWRDEVDASLRALNGHDACRYRLELRQRVSVPGYSVEGNELGEGLYLEGDFIIAIRRSSPEGEEELAFYMRDKTPLLGEGGSWREAESDEMPSPLCDPFLFADLVADHGVVTLEGEEERNGAVCRRYLLQADGGRAREALSALAWSYFSELRFEMTARVWVANSGAPPVSLQLEVTGTDPVESTQRYRLLATLDPYDLGSPDIEIDPVPADGSGEDR